MSESKQNQEEEEFVKKIDGLLKTIHDITSMIKKEATRSNTDLKLKYFTAGKKEEGRPFSHMTNEGKQQPYDEYNILISKQFTPLLMTLSKQVSQIKHSTLKELRSKQKKESNISEYKKLFRKKEQTLKRVWRQQSYLMCNYRMDIVAKQIERWEIGLVQKFDEKKIKQEVDALFK